MVSPLSNGFKHSTVFVDALDHHVILVRTQQNHTSPIPRSASDLALASNKHVVVLALVCHSAASGKGSQHNFLDLGTLSPKGQKPGALWGRKRYHQERSQVKVHLGELRIHKGRSSLHATDSIPPPLQIPVQGLSSCLLSGEFPCGFFQPSVQQSSAPVHDKPL